jgi:hypothetical protein
VPFDHRDPGPDVRVLDRHVGERLDVQARRHLDDLCSDVAAGSDPRIQVPR